MARECSSLVAFGGTRTQHCAPYLSHIVAHLCNYGRSDQETTNSVSFDASHQAEANGLGIKVVRPILTKLCVEIFPIFRNLSRYNSRLRRVRQKEVA